jgi:hypothetical protein
MQLDVMERLVLLSILPREGNFTTLKLMRKLREDLSFSEEEHKLLMFVQEGDRVKWNLQAGVMKDFDFGDVVNGIIVNQLKKLDKENKLSDDSFTLYEKFIGGT